MISEQEIEPCVINLFSKKGKTSIHIGTKKRPKITDSKHLLPDFELTKCTQLLILNFKLIKKLVWNGKTVLVGNIWLHKTI